MQSLGPLRAVGSGVDSSPSIDSCGHLRGEDTSRSPAIGVAQPGTPNDCAEPSCDSFPVISKDGDLIRRLYLSALPRVRPCSAWPAATSSCPSSPCSAAWTSTRRSAQASSEVAAPLPAPVNEESKTPALSSPRNVRNWHKADIVSTRRNVRYRGHSGHQLNTHRCPQMSQSERCQKCSSPLDISIPPIQMGRWQPLRLTEGSWSSWVIPRRSGILPLRCNTGVTPGTIRQSVFCVKGFV
jgi:hypothetical protein